MKNLAVLLVDDQTLVRMVASEFLMDAGHIVVEASTAEEALAKLAVARVDVIMTDVHLPTLSGVELAEKAREINPAVGIVFATGARAPTFDPGDGAVAVLLAKPFTKEDLDRAIDAAGAHLRAGPLG